jgi:hypothetical protein
MSHALHFRQTRQSLNLGMINQLFALFNGHTYCRLRNGKLFCQNALTDADFSHGPITRDAAGTQGISMNVPYQLQKIGILKNIIKLTISKI